MSVVESAIDQSEKVETESFGKKLSIKIEPKTLSHALTFANSIVEKRNISAELGNIKLSAQNGALEIAATDMELYLSLSLGAHVMSTGITTVSTTILTEIVSQIIDDEISLTQIDENQLKLEAKNLYFNLVTLPANKFPVMEQMQPSCIMNISCSEFVRLITSTQFSMSTEETRYNLNGIYLHVYNGYLSSVATDGHRLSVASTKVDDNTPEFGIIIPRKATQEILKIAKDSKNINLDLEIAISTNKVRFNCNNITLISKLIDGTFPDYEAFIPNDTTSKLSVNAKLLANAIKRVSIVTTDKFRAIKLILTKGNIELVASDISKGTAREVLDASEEEKLLCKFDGEESFTVGFNPSYLTDVLGLANKNAVVEFYFTSPFSPALVRITGQPDDKFVIMPVKV